MRLVIEIECDNAAFGDDTMDECEEIVTRAFRYFGARSEMMPLRDSNGNTVGKMELVQS